MAGEHEQQLPGLRSALEPPDRDGLHRPRGGSLVPPAGPPPRRERQPPTHLPAAIVAGREAHEGLAAAGALNGSAPVVCRWRLGGDSGSRPTSPGA
jgi:hypothetical protein